MMDHIFHSLAPGPLSNNQIRTLIRKEVITGISADSKDIDCSSFDLHITDEGYRLEGSIKPFSGSYSEDELKYAKKLKSVNGQYILDRNNTYVFRLAEKISISPKKPEMKEHLNGIATGRSSIGRVDVLVRLIVDGMDLYDRYKAERATGSLFIEIIPITFNVIVKPGIALSQLRLFWGKPTITKIETEEVKLRKFLRPPEGQGTVDNADSLTVNLNPSQSVSSGNHAIALKARENEEPVPLWRDEGEDGIEPDPYWEPIPPETDQKFGSKQYIKLEKNRFYILRSRELICLPPGIAVYCRAMDEALGEMRIHYAGFVHPYFGYKRKSAGEGTNLIFEVRGHNMDIFLTHGETLANLEFYRMSEDAEEEEETAYGEQELKLSKFFGDWS